MIGQGEDKEGQKSIEQAILEYLEALYGYAMSLARNPVEAEDLVQETYLRAIKGARRSMPTGDLKAWLFRILRNIWINQRRRAQGSELLLGIDIEGLESESEWTVKNQQRPDTIFEQGLLRENIRIALESLPEAFREVIVLRCMEGFSYSQIAEILGCPVGTVMSRINRARAELRRRLNKWADGFCGK